MTSTSNQLLWLKKNDILHGYVINEYGFKRETPYEIHNELEKDFFCAYEVCQVTKTRKPLPIENYGNLDELKSFVQDYYLRQVRLEQEYCLFHDNLSRVYHHRYLREFLANQVQIAKINNRSLSLIYIDIDNFRHINDHFGLSDGDTTIISLASVIQNSVGPGDILGRWGGDEFLVIMPEVNLAEAEIKAEKIKSSVSSHLFHLSNGDTFQLSISVGVSTLEELELKEPDELLRVAEERMQTAKSETVKSA